MGRYVFTPEIFDALEQVQPGVGGEIQLTDAIALLLGDQSVYGYIFADGRYDIGKKLDYLRATVELAARARRPRSRVPRVPRRLRAKGRGLRVIPSTRPRRFVLGGLPAAPPRRASPLADALGLRHRRRRSSPTEAVPPFANTAMDGFAVRAADTAGATGATPVRLAGRRHDPGRHGARPSRSGRARRSGS